MRSSGMPSKRIFMSSTRIDRHAGLADIADHARVIAVIAAVGGEVEGHRKALLPGGEIAAVEGVRFLGGREAGILPHRPRAAGVHRRPRAAQERRQARQRSERMAGGGDVLEVGGRVERLDVDALGGAPDQVAGVPPLELAGRGRLPRRDLRRCGGWGRFVRFSRHLHAPARCSPVCEGGAAKSNRGGARLATAAGSPNSPR